MIGLHALASRLDERIRRLDDVSRGAVVVQQISRPSLVIGLELADEGHRGALEGIDVLVVVADGEQAELALLVLQAAADDRGDEFVFVGPDVLVFIDQNPPKPGQQAIALLVGFLGRQSFTLEQRQGVAQHLFEVVVSPLIRVILPACADQAHGEGMAGQHRDALRVVADQLMQALADLDCGMMVVRQRQDAARVLPAHPQQVSDAVHQNAGLARSRSRQHQHMGLVAIIGDDALLVGIVERRHDGLPRGRRGLARQFLFPAGQPALQKARFRQPEIIQRQLQSLRKGDERAPRILGHDVDLEPLGIVVQFQRLEVGLGEIATLGDEFERHGRTENRQTLAEPQDLLFMQPQQGAVEQSRQIR